MSDPLQQQQPVLVYPNAQPQPPALSHSKGSFGASFIVLAVIIVVSATACFLSRLCNKRGQKKPKQEKPHKQQKKGQGVTFPPQQSRRKEMDMEFGGGRGPGIHQQQPKGNDIKFGFDSKSSSRQPKGSDIEMGFDTRRFPSGKGAQKPYPNPNGVMKGETINPHFNGGRWGGQ